MFLDMTTESGTPRHDWSGPLAGLFLLTLVGGLLALDFLPEWRANHFYVEGRCVLLDKRLAEDPPSGKAFNSTYRPEFLIRHTVAGREYRVWTYDAVHATTALRWPKESILDSFTIGQAYPCWYDPADPSQVVLVRGYSWWTYGFLVVFLVLLFLTGKGVLWRLRSRRCAADEASGVGS
jgi:hypothetical protein